MWVLGRNGPFNLDLMLRFANQAWECKWRNRRTEAEFHKQLLALSAQTYPFLLLIKFSERPLSARVGLFSSTGLLGFFSLSKSHRKDLDSAPSTFFDDHTLEIF